MRLFLTVAMLMTVACGPVSALDSAVPGQSLEGIRLGMSPNAACKLILGRNQYGAKWIHSASHHYQFGLIEDDLDWHNSNFLLNIEVLSRNGVVVQISRTENDNTPQTDYSFGKLKLKHHLQEKSYNFDSPDGGGIEGYYFDDVQHGVCFVGLSQDVFFLTAKPDTLIVHKDMTPVIPISQGIIGKRNYGPGGKVYANDEDYIRQTEHEKNDY